MGRRESKTSIITGSETPGLGARIRAMRKQQYPTLVHFEEATGVSRSYLSRVERDKVERVSDTVLESIARALHVPSTEFGIQERPERLMARYLAEEVSSLLGPQLNDLSRRLLALESRIDQIFK